MSFENFTVTNEYDIEFDINNVKLSVVNSLRRAMLSEIPVYTFDDTWHDNTEERSINILKNTSGIHNEFLSHRISLIPVCMHDSDLIEPIITRFNTDTQEREFLLPSDYSEKLGIFTLSKKNNQLTKELDNKTIDKEIDYLNQKKMNLIEKDLEEIVKEKLIVDMNKQIEFLDEKKKNTSVKVTSQDIKCKDINIQNLFKRSIYSNDFILIDLLKTNYNDPDDGEEIDINMVLTVSNAKKKAQYSPTGTVSLSYNIDNEKSEQAFAFKIEHMNQERESKKLEHLNDSEISKLKNSYDLLDRDRYFISDSNNNPTSFHLRIESIGFLHSSQIFYDSVKLLETRLFDIVSCFTNDNYYISYSKKISIEMDNSLQNEFIYVHDENHTIGNLINSYLLDYVGPTQLLEISGYKMPHPLERKIMFNLVLNEKRENQFLDIYKNYFKLTQNPPEEFDLQKNFKILIFVNVICRIIKDLKNILEQFKTYESIYNEPQFSYLKKTIYNLDDIEHKPLNYPSFVNEDSDKIFKFGSFNFSLNDTDLTWKQLRKVTKVIKKTNPQ